MNDRFRFRAWNREEKIYHYGVENTYDYMNGLPSVMKCCFGSVLEDTGEGNRYVVEQCTGLKDKNGRLIYEGDIVVLDDTDSFENPIKTIVRWAEENACFGLFVSRKLYYGFGSYERGNFEIVGNIHENPELLEDK